ncbi:ACP S-malonyltransferase [Massilia litorea]|uniref:Acyltransferase domain-containing protein n=1 Tax=Massilia litorea TaxID=2769491 RepID=A0A7L9U1H6_9BURK|nr:acyltransferase domain-containing protein [Massilia litorea]QOL48873.1 acyltransferase domain-containing protein [Massilia litorea]
MSARLLILCPGQGGQHAAMYDLARGDPAGAALLDACAPALDPDTLFDNRIAQPAIVAATLATWEALRPRLPAPALVAGYSIGELAAHGVAGALPAQDAIALASRRAALMDAAAAAGVRGALAAVSALPLERVRAIARACDWQLAIVNGEDACVAGGPASTYETFAGACEAAGARMQRLPVAVASHTPLIAAAVQPFAGALAGAPFHGWQCPVLSGISGVRIASKDAAVEHLSRQLAETIEWRACMDAAVESGISVALELGPGAALARMFAARHPQVACRSVAEFRSLDGVAAWVERQFER